ncbi:putative transcription factor C2H2 family [Helianthus annuus]|nr:putative transcription factor C2H2 family [Helianthus annuus]
MDPYYHHHPILQQQYYAYVVPVFAVPTEWMVYDQVNTPAHYTVPMFYPQPVQYVDDIAILNTPDAMWVNQEQHPTHSYAQNQYVPYDHVIHEFEAFLEERLMRIEQEAGRALQQVNAGTSGSGLSEEEISEHLQKMGRLECGHRFHAECIKRWLLSKNVCPMCRSTTLSFNYLILIRDVILYNWFITIGLDISRCEL